MAKKIEVNYKIGADSKSAVNAVDKLNVEFQRIDKQLKEINRATAIEKLASEAAEFTAKTNSSEKALAALNKRLQTVNASQKEATRAAQTYLDTLNRIKAQPTIQTPQFGGVELGRLASGAGAAASVISGVGGADAAEAVRLGGSALGFAKQIDSVREALKAAGQAAAASTGLVGNLAGGITALAPGLGGASAGVLALGAAIAPIALVLGATALAVASVADAFERTRREAELAASDFSKEVEARVQARRLLGSNNAVGLSDLYKSGAEELGVLNDQAEEFRKRIAELNAEFEAPATEGSRNKRQVSEEINSFQAQLDALTPSIDEANRQFYEVGLIYNSAAGQALVLAQAEKERIEAAAKAFEPTILAIREVGAALDSGLNTEQLNQRIASTKAALQTEIEVRQRLIDQGLETSSQYQQSEQQTAVLNARLAELETSTVNTAAAANSAAQASEKAANALKQASAAMEEFQKRAEDIAASRALADARAAEDEATREKRAQEDLARALEQQGKAHQDRMADIAAKGQAAIQQAQQDLIQKQIEAAEQIALLQAQFAEESLRAQQQFEKERLRRQRDFETARKRLEEDFQIDRFDAILSGDIAGALRAERDFKISKRRGKEDFRTQEGDLSEDFAIEQAERAAALAQKIAEIQTELAEYTAATQAKIAAIQAQTQAELQAEQAAYEEKLALDAELRDIQRQRELEDSELRRARLIEDRQIEDAKAQEALNLRLSQIQQESSAQSAAHQTAVSGINNVANAAQRLIAIAQNAARALSGGSSVPPRTSAGGQGVRPFAEGGIVKAGGEPLLGLFERKQTEAVIPLDSSMGQRLLGGMGGGTSPQLNVTVNVDGANGSPEDIGNAVVGKIKEVVPPILEEYTRRLMRGTSQS